ncbi:MAG TPA: HdeD family acid-resistance protein [Wenzhouxiangellaceae bacterium]|nr:HdeD family acid-resistance protein [Wenzhouxiangellaceae bacterium]
MDTNDQLEVVTDKPRGSGFMVAIGVISIILGIAALVFPWWATLGVELVFGFFLLIVGVLELIRVAFDRPPGGIALSVIFGILAIVAGGLLLTYPLQGVVTLTLVLAFFFLLGGIFKTAAAWTLPPGPGRRWLLISGVISLVLALIVLVALPESAFWLLGVLLGIDLIFFGAAQIAFATAVRDMRRTGPI